jgi:hypothetical protein
MPRQPAEFPRGNLHACVATSTSTSTHPFAAAPWVPHERITDRIILFPSSETGVTETLTINRRAGNNSPAAHAGPLRHSASLSRAETCRSIMTTLRRRDDQSSRYSECMAWAGTGVVGRWPRDSTLVQSDGHRGGFRLSFVQISDSPSASTSRRTPMSSVRCGDHRQGQRTTMRRQ